MTYLRRTSRTGALHCHNSPTSIMKISHPLQNLDCGEQASLIKKYAFWVYSLTCFLCRLKARYKWPFSLKA